MQERYCTCGARIIVQFTNDHRDWQTAFWARQQFNGTRLYVCPSCGHFLDIDALN